jgi:hypothetical protein
MRDRELHQRPAHTREEGAARHISGGGQEKGGKEEGGGGCGTWQEGRYERVGMRIW